MAQLGYTADPNQPEESFEIVPAGEYTTIIEASDYTPNKQGTGMILKLTYQIIDGEFKGRKIFENLNLQNENAQAAQIAQRALNSICLAVGVQHVQDSAQLHGIPLILDVSVKEDATYGKQNRIKKHIPVSGQTSAPATSGFVQTQPQQQTAPQGTAKKDQPWARK